MIQPVFAQAGIFYFCRHV